MQPEKMRVWLAAEQMIAEIDQGMATARRYAPNAAEHLERCAESVVFNIGEGVGAYQPKVKISCYEIAKKEANEIRAILRRLVVKKVFTPTDIRRPYNLAGAIVGMLTAAIITLSRR